jgi:hypothetical protein
LYSELTKVTWRPRACSSLATLSIGVMCPCAGYGRHTACAFFSSAALPSIGFCRFSFFLRNGKGMCAIFVSLA